MNSAGVRRRAMLEQENKGRVPSPLLLHPGREGLSEDGIGGEIAVKTYWKKERM